MPDTPLASLNPPLLQPANIPRPASLIGALDEHHRIIHKKRAEPNIGGTFLQDIASSPTCVHSPAHPSNKMPKETLICHVCTRQDRGQAIDIFHTKCRLHTRATYTGFTSYFMESTIKETETTICWNFFSNSRKKNQTKDY